MLDWSIEEVNNLYQYRLVRKWIHTLVFCSVIAITLFASGIREFALRGSWEDIGGGLFAFCILAYSGFSWSRLLRGRVVGYVASWIYLSGGELQLNFPSGQMELWIFSTRPLALFHGSIAIEMEGAKEPITATLPRRNRFLYPRRANYTPFVISLPPMAQSGATRGKVKFSLRPSFESDGRSSESEVALVLKTQEK